MRRLRNLVHVPSTPKSAHTIMVPDKFVVHDGKPLPLGASFTKNGTNFSVYARENTYMTLMLFKPGEKEVLAQLKLSATHHRTGHVWHCEVRPKAGGLGYLWRVGATKDPRWISNECLDPYAKILDSPVGPSSFNNRTLPEYSPRALVPTTSDALDIDWEDVPKPKIAWNKLVVYEMHVRGFSKLAPVDKDPRAPATFSAVVQRIPYLKSLGVNCVELLPVMEFNEREWSHVSPTTGKHLSQYWGYSTVAFFTPMNRFGRDGTTPEEVVREFKYMVRELHRAHIEVILDVVYNHTAEMALDFVGPGHYGMKTLAPFTYYILRDNGRTFVNHTGCGNTVNCNNPIVQDLIVESLRYWAHEMRVDGFRFDLASVFCRDTDGNPMERPPVVERISKDATMRDVKLIAEPWDCGGLYQVGSFPHFGTWAEWNGKFRDCVRRFIKGDPGMLGDFATRLCGSEDMYGKDGRQPQHSINFVTAHDGFSLWDLVSYNHKCNADNGEQNQDGENHNDSWNCGVEGETTDKGVLSLRARQIRNMFVAVLVSNGTPMLRMGDEYGLTQHGNNNGWCQDSHLCWFEWKKASDTGRALVRFASHLVHLRQNASALQRNQFLSPSHISWHGAKPHEPNWHSQYNFIAFVLHGADDLYIAFNAGGNDYGIKLPPARTVWHRVVDTNLPSPRDFSENPAEKPIQSGEYTMAPYSAIILTQLGVDRRGSSPDMEIMFKQMSLDMPNGK